jgi:purine nucleoside phosphorylase
MTRSSYQVMANVAVDTVTQTEELSAQLSAKLDAASNTRVLVIAGSGLGGFVRSVQPRVTISYADLPHVGASTVVGHAGNLIYGTVQSGAAPAELLLMAGRRHLYEGISAHASTVLLRALLLALPNLRSNYKQCRGRIKPHL